MIKMAFAATFAVALVLVTADTASAATACAKSQAASAACKAPYRNSVHGTVRPRSKLAILPRNLLPENRNPLLYNLPREFNPLDFPYNDNIRQDYPGLGLYR